MIKPFKTTLLDRRLREKRRENEKLRQQTLRRVFNMLPRLAVRYGFNRAYVFGSLVKRGRFRENSDVDIAVEGLNNENYFKLMADLSDQIGREVDVVQLEKHRLREQIKESGRQWNKRS
jgi:hypothetical protein